MPVPMLHFFNRLRCMFKKQWHIIDIGFEFITTFVAYVFHHRKILIYLYRLLRISNRNKECPIGNKISLGFEQKYYNISYCDKLI